MPQTKQTTNTAKPKKSNNREARVLAILGGAAIIVFVFIALLTRSQEEAAPIVRVDQSILMRPDSMSRGPADASVFLVEFLDFECEACRAAYPAIERILEEYDGRVRYVVRYFSNHNNSVLAVAAAEAAGEQGKYWEMMEILFANQPQWGEQAAPQTDAFIAYATELGLDVEQFTASLQNPVYAEKAERDQQDTRTLGLRGTPTFFVNGQMVYGLDEGTLRRLIEEGLQG